MKREDLKLKIQEKTGLTLAQSERALDAMLNGIILGVVSEGRVTFKGFGSFGRRKAKAYMANDLHGRGKLLIGAKTRVVFRPSLELKTRVDRGER